MTKLTMKVTGLDNNNKDGDVEVKLTAPGVNWMRMTVPAIEAGEFVLGKQYVITVKECQ